MNSRFPIRWVVFLIGAGACAETQVDVRVVHGRFAELVRSQAVADEILRQVDVRVNWSLADRVPSQAGTGGAIYLKIISGAPAAQRPGAFGYAYPHADRGVRVVIYYDRVLQVSRRHGVPVSRVLGHALAHELGHVLRADRGHSESGLMRASWTEDQFSLLRRETLPFAEQDVQRITGRLSRLAMADNLNRPETD